MYQNLNLELFQLCISEEVKKKLDKRGIFIEEVKEVICHAENTNKKLVNKANCHFVSHLVLGAITCWVEYSVKEKVYILHNAYFHRIKIEEE